MNIRRAHESATAETLVDPPLEAAIDAAVDRRQRQIVELRRHLHANPEPSGEEFATTQHLYQLLFHEGLQVHLGPEGRGLWAELPGVSPGSLRVAYRGDIDALRILDAKTDCAYRSQNAGVMHACGHDAHAAMLAGTLLVLRDLDRDGKLPAGTPIRGIFQPAEETCEGAIEMIRAGAMDSVAAILAVHVDPGLPLGQVGLRSGALTANCDDLRLEIRGRGGHAARPHESIDPIAAAAQVISALYLNIPRSVANYDPAIVTIATLRGGDATNVIPESAQLGGTIRTLSEPVRQRTMEQVERIARGVAEATGTQIAVQFEAACESVVNDPELVAGLREVSVNLLGLDRVVRIDQPSMGSEDFAFYLRQAPGAMLRLGIRSGPETGHSLHSPHFDIDEAALKVGVRLMTRSLLHTAAGVGVTSEPRSADAR